MPAVSERTARQSLFFDRKAVVDLIGKKRAAALARSGRYIQRVARNSIKRKGAARKAPKGEKARERWLLEEAVKKGSPPGTPPFTHTGFLRNDIQFNYDPATKSVVVGPSTLAWLNTTHEFGGSRRVDRKKNRRRSKRYLYGGGEIRIAGPVPPDGLAPTATAPSYVKYCFLRSDRQVERSDRLNEALYGPYYVESHTAKYPPRPFMTPALQKSTQYIGSAWLSTAWAADSTPQA